MEGEGLESASVRFDVRDLLAREARQGPLRPLEHYQARFPAHAALVAEEYRRCSDGHETHRSGPPTPVVAGGDAAPEGFRHVLDRLTRPVPRGTRYTKEETIARGGMGTVYRVRDTELGRALAMKEINADVSAGDPLSAARFLEEAQVTAQLDHPGIVPVHEVGVDAQGRLYFAMKLVRGRDLRRVLELLAQGKEGWNQTRVLTVILRVCEAMAYAHTKGVIHRDLKPSNVMVGHFGEVYVMDWGLARTLGRRDLHDLRIQRQSQSVSLRTLRREERESDDASPLLTMNGEILGTPAYMPPEQARGELDELTPRADVYSIGAILYHLLAGEAPYAARGQRLGPHTILALVLNGPPPSVESLAPDASPELVAICNKAMAREAQHRYPDVSALGEDLRAFLEGRVVKAYARGPVAELGKWIRRNKAFAAASGAALLALVGGLATSTRYQIQAADRAVALAAESARANEAALEAERSAHEVMRLSDLQELRDLEVEADSLWPIGPELEPALTAWLERAHKVIASRAEHQATLAGLTGDTPGDNWRRGQLQLLLATIDAFEDPRHGLVRGSATERGPSIEQRLQDARTIVARSIDSPEAEDRWYEVIEGIQSSPRYAGLDLLPQEGLLPLGADPDSGLWEFAHLLSGEPARRGPDGKLAVTADTGIVFVLIPGGAFRMGAQAEDPDGPDYSPFARSQDSLREAVIQPFFLSKYELTQGQWERMFGENPSENGAGDPEYGRLPVERMSQDECVALLERYELTLPTQAEWEFAARAGTRTVWWTGDDPTSLRGAANLADRSRESDGALAVIRDEALDDGANYTTYVGSYAPNAFGLHDVIGNVAEWCLDAASNGQSQANLRGGSFNSIPADATCALRLWYYSNTRSWDLGLRPARRIR